MLFRKGDGILDEIMQKDIQTLKEQEQEGIVLWETISQKHPLGWVRNPFGKASFVRLLKI